MIDELIGAFFAIRAARAAGLANNAPAEDLAAVVRIEVKLRALLINALKAENAADAELIAATSKGEPK
jgi:hypothetical protein